MRQIKGASVAIQLDADAVPQPPDVNHNVVVLLQVVPLSGYVGRHLAMSLLRTQPNDHALPIARVWLLRVLYDVSHDDALGASAAQSQRILEAFGASILIFALEVHDVELKLIHAFPVRVHNEVIRAARFRHVKATLYLRHVKIAFFHV